ncbi:MAG: hypothetical protein RLY16_822 [Bacteroidota bacterium]|jgi:hypothetical protein
MKASLMLYQSDNWSVHPKSDNLDPQKTSLVLGFGEKGLLADQPIYDQLREKFPQANIVLCSTSGEIFDESVYDESVSVSAIEFEKTTVHAVSIKVGDYTNSFEAGKALVNQLELENLAYILVLSDGTQVNGSELVRGVNSVINYRVPVTGGLAGDAARFQSTLVGLNQVPSAGNIVAIAFYGQHLSVAHSSMGGWDTFGPEREITKSDSNVLYEIDGKNALELYKLYLGDYAKELPGSALLFPLSVKLTDSSEPVVRTILTIDNEKQAMVFAGDVPIGSQVRFMRANFDRLVDAATQAGCETLMMKPDMTPKLAILISCVGRKLILEGRVEEEVVAVGDAFNNNTLLTGFYSYGEISPFSPKSKCELHNQTMTITTFNEI